MAKKLIEQYRDAARDSAREDEARSWTEGLIRHLSLR
jgi:hypothetical protein